jgi:putative DNA primase/helicase
VACALTSLVVIDGSAEQPCWLDGGPVKQWAPLDGHVPAHELLACRNGLLHLPGWADGKPSLLPPTPRLFTPTALPYDFDPDAPEPVEWLAFLSKLWPEQGDRQDEGDEEKGAPSCIDVLQEWLGYLLLPDTSQHKIALLVGPKRGGKGTIGRVLTRLVGPNNVCNPTLASLGDPFGLQPLLGKTVALVSDARLSGRADLASVAERLLSISGEDAQTVNRKHLSQVTGRLPVRFTIMSNELPRLTDMSGALAGRLLVLRMTESWYGKEDTKLTGRLLRELPGILLWAMRGWVRLRERGYFVQPRGAAGLVEQMEDLASPVAAFVRDHCDVGVTKRVTVEAIYDRWRRWCVEQGRDVTSEMVFGRDLRAACPSVERRLARTPNSRRYSYFGINLRPEAFGE